LVAKFKRVFWYINESVSPFGAYRGPLAFWSLNNLRKTRGLRLWFGSAATRDLWRQWGFDGDVIYWTGVSQTQLQQPRLREHAKNILCVGTFHPVKGIHHLVRAFHQALSTQVIPGDTTLTVLGLPDPVTDPFALDVMNFIDQHRLHDRIHVYAKVPPEKVVEFYRQADLYVQPSSSECLPLALADAAAYGVPIITTDALGCVEVADQGRAGIVVPKRNTHALVAALQRAFQSVEARQTMASQAQDSFKRLLTKEHSVEKMKTVLMGTPGSRA
jgi:glycosyltransferase involved in cell wall biosynthesis